MYKIMRYLFWLVSFLFLIFFIYQLSLFNFNLINFFNCKYYYIAYIFGAVGGLFAIENFYRKEGISVLGNLTTTKYFGEFDENFDTSFKNLTLINRKDKPIIIFDIYIKVAQNTFIHLKEVSKENPIIIKSYEHYHEDFNEAFFYSSGINAYSLKLSKVIKNFQIFLHTSEGMYKVKRLKSHNSFYKFYSRILRPARLEFNSKSVPLDVNFIVSFCDLKDNFHTIYIKKSSTFLQVDEYKFYWTEPLNKKILHEKINLGIKSNQLKIKNLKVIDFQEKLKSFKNDFIQFKDGYNPLKIECDFEKSNQKKMVFIYYKNKIQKIISLIKNIPLINRISKR